MKTLCIVFALFNQFQIEELAKVDQPISPIGIFIQEELPQPKAAIETRPHFEFLGASWCGYCGPARALVDAIPEKDRPFTYSYRDVDSKGNLGANTIPAWAYKGKVFQYGYSNPKNLMENFRRIFQPKAKANTVQRLSSAQLREFANSYSGPGMGVDGDNFWYHLQEANHGFTANQLSGLTQWECARIHGAHHNGYLTPFSIGGK